MKKPRVFLIFYNLSFGGVQTKMIDLANALVDKNVDCWIFTSNDDQSRLSLLDKRVHVIRCSDFIIFAHPPFRKFRFVLPLTVAILALRPDCIFVSMCTLAVRLVLFLRKISPSTIKKIVVNEDTYPSLELSYSHPLYGRSQISSVYPRVKRVVAVSKDTYQDLQNTYHLPSPPLTYLPNWVSFDNHTVPSNRDRPIDLIYGGRLESQKRPLLLMDYLTTLLSLSPNLVIRIFGDGTYQPQVEKKVADLQKTYNIKLEPLSISFRSYLQQSKMIVFTSLYEGLPFVGLEAMKYGAILTALSAPGLRDIILRGRTGVLEPTIQTLACSTINLFQSASKMSSFRVAAYLHARRHYSEKNRERLIKMLLT